MTSPCHFDLRPFFVPSHTAMAPTSWRNHNDLATLFPRLTPNQTSPVNIETRSSWGRRAIHFKRWPLKQNGRCRQSHYFMSDKTIDLFGGQKVIQINFKNGRYVDKYINYMRLSLQYAPCVCFLESNIYCKLYSKQSYHDLALFFCPKTDLQ